jgi:hypothetical protein
VISPRKNDRQPSETDQSIKRRPNLGGQSEFRLEIMEFDRHLVNALEKVIW